MRRNRHYWWTRVRLNWLYLTTRKWHLQEVLSLLTIALLISNVWLLITRW